MVQKPTEHQTPLYMMNNRCESPTTKFLFL